MRFLLILICLFISSSYMSGGSIKEEAEKSIKEAFGEGIRLEFEKYEIPSNLKLEIEREARQAFYTDFLYVWKAYKEGKLVSYCILDNVLGKTLPITFLVSFNLEGYVSWSKIVKYREPYGGGVASESWNNQFVGKNAKSGYKIGTDIDAITGATISVRSVSTGIYKLALLFDKIKNNI